MTDMEQATLDILATTEKHDPLVVLPAIFTILDAGIASGDLCADCARLMVGRLMQTITKHATDETHSTH